MIFDQRIQVWLSPVMSARSSASGLGSIAEPTIADAPHPAVPVPPRKPKLRKKAKKLMPEAFKKCPRFAKGPICWAFNSEGCSAETKVVDGLPRCAKGFHVCVQCHKANHSFATCRAKPKS